MNLYDPFIRQKLSATVLFEAEAFWDQIDVNSMLSVYFALFSRTVCSHSIYYVSFQTCAIELCVNHECAKDSVPARTALLSYYLRGEV